MVRADTPVRPLHLDAIRQRMRGGQGTDQRVTAETGKRGGGVHGELLFGDSYFFAGNPITRPMYSGGGRSLWSSTMACSFSSTASVKGAERGPARSTCSSICSLPASSLSPPTRCRLW